MKKNDVSIKIFGALWPSCNDFAMVAKRIGDASGAVITVEMVFDYEETIAQHLEDLPAIVVDGRCVWSGNLPEADEFGRWLKEYLSLG